MKQKRASFSKRARFAIFERDSFTCQYCGKRPPETVLQLDHIHPISMGGEDTEDNLTTACVECNAGKTNRVLGSVIPRPDADAKYLAIQQEIAETRLYLEAKKERDELLKEVAGEILVTWRKFADRWFSEPKEPTILGWLSDYGAEEVFAAIMSASKKNSTLQGRDGFVKYVSGILRNRRDEGRS